MCLCMMVKLGGLSKYCYFHEIYGDFKYIHCLMHVIKCGDVFASCHIPITIHSHKSHAASWKYFNT